MPSLTSQLILSLVDNLSGPARQAAQNLGQTAKAIEQAGKGIKAAQWGTALQQELNKLKLSTRDLDAVRRSWEDFQRSIREGPPPNLRDLPSGAGCLEDASPTISPRFAPAPADSGSQETRRAGIRTAYNDYGIGELA